MLTALAPYRIAPLGAHVDHQGGPVLGAAIDDYSTVVFEKSEDGRVSLRSDLFDQPVEFLVNTPTVKTGWGRYAAGAAAALQRHTPSKIRYGLTGRVNGGWIGAGLSSSASIGVAYLMALAAVNELPLTKSELVELDRLIENDYLGLNNGIQDQTTIVYARPDALIYQDTRRRKVSHLPHPPTVGEVGWLLIHSGFERELTGSGFNGRVAECRRAAKILDPKAEILSDIPPQQFLRCRDELPATLRRRAGHFFGEVERVNRGAEAWREGRWVEFGQLMNRSCHSSITLYESGTPPIIDLHQLTSAQSGVLGSRFCGGGYGGCVVALVEKDHIQLAGETILEQYLRRYPQKAGRALFREAVMVRGAEIVES